MDIQMRVTTTASETSPWSVIVTYYCATAPAQADAPCLADGSCRPDVQGPPQANQEIIEVLWNSPHDGGSAITAFYLYMKDESAADYSMVCCDNMDSLQTRYVTTTGQLGQPLVAGNYYFKLVSHNIASQYLGPSADSPVLTVPLSLFTSASKSKVSGSGIELSYGAATAEVSVTCFDEDGDAKTSGGDLIFLHIE